MDTIQTSTVNGQIDQYIPGLAMLSNAGIALFYCPNITCDTLLKYTLQSSPPFFSYYLHHIFPLPCRAGLYKHWITDCMYTVYSISLAVSCSTPPPKLFCFLFLWLTLYTLLIQVLTLDPGL